MLEIKGFDSPWAHRSAWIRLICVSDGMCRTPKGLRLFFAKGLRRAVWGITNTTSRCALKFLDL